MILSRGREARPLYVRSAIGECFVLTLHDGLIPTRMTIAYPIHPMCQELAYDERRKLQSSITR
jgi:hypothetical protein